MKSNPILLKRIIPFLLFAGLTLSILSACAPTHQSSTTVTRVGLTESTSTLDSARFLIRRGLFNEARSVLQDYLTGKCVSPELFCAIYRLNATALEKQEQWSEAAEYWKTLVTQFTDTSEFHIRYWNCKMNMFKNDSLQSDSLNRIIRLNLEQLSCGASLTERNLAYIYAQILRDTTADMFADRLIEAFPTSDEATAIIGNRFWDGLYPIWTNDSAKVPYLKDFIAKYSANSWSNYGFRNLMGSYLALKDTGNAVRTACDWVAREPDQPNMLLTAGSSLLDIPQGEDSALVWIERAYQHRANVVRPQYISPAEWLLYEQQTKASIPLLMAEIRLRAGNLADARRYAEESLSLAVYDLDDNNTAAPQHLMLGRIAHLEGDSAATARHWVETARLGDVYDRFARRAIDSLKTVFGLKGGTELLNFCRKTAGYTGITFDRLTDSLGLSSACGSRIAWSDFDNDGDDDILCGGTRLYRNDSMNFIDVTAAVGLTATGCHGGIWADFDADANLDLFCFSSSPDIQNAERLYQWRGRKSVRNPVSGDVNSMIEMPLLEDVTVRSPGIVDSFSTEAAIWLDANGDRRLDLFIAGYERPYGSASEMGSGWPDRLMIQDSSGVFTDSTEAYGLIPPSGKHLCGRSPVACDFDRDGDMDLYVGNYRLQENLFWINNTYSISGNIENSKFTNRAAYYAVNGEEVEGWWGHTIGCEWGDFDGDGDFDLIVCNLAHPRYIGFSNRTMLYRNDGPDKPFTDVRKVWGIKYEECHSEPVWGDFDNDGDLDLYITCVYPNRRSFLYENKDDHFEDITFLSGTRIFNGWGCATADYDNDGRLDLAACGGGKVELFRNTSENSNNWISIRYHFRMDPLLQIGTIVEACAGGQVIIRQIEGGKGAGSQNSQTLHFGVGKIERVSLRFFNNGKSSELFEDIPVNRTYWGIEDILYSPKR